MIASALIMLLLAPLACWWFVWLVLVVVAALPERRGGSPRKTGRNVAGARINILVPAHDEESVLPNLLESLRRQNAAGRRCMARLLVVADHCQDRTATIARRFGAEVLERATGPRGKPAALRDGIAWLEQTTSGARDTPDSAVHGLLILDADCTTSPNLLEEFARSMAAGHPVAQAAYLLDPSDTTKPDEFCPASFAFALKNFLRPKGLARLGLPTQLFGTGMCFRAELLDAAEGAAPIMFSDHLTEDLAMSHDLLRRGVHPVFIATATIRSPAPAGRRAMSTQRLRWETGQVHTWKTLPRLFGSLLARARFTSALALVDWSAPPLAMALLAWGAIVCLSLLFIRLDAAPGALILLPFAVLSLLIGYLITGAIYLAGAAVLPRMAMAVPQFVFWKLTLYGRMLAGQGAHGWQKTPRCIDPGALPSFATHEARS